MAIAYVQIFAPNGATHTTQLEIRGRNDDGSVEGWTVKQEGPEGEKLPVVYAETTRLHTVPTSTEPCEGGGIMWVRVTLPD